MNFMAYVYKKLTYNKQIITEIDAVLICEGICGVNKV